MKLYFVLSTFLIISQISIAQDSTKIIIGVQVGYDYSDLRVKKSEKTSAFGTPSEFEFSGINSFNINSYLSLRGKSRFSVSIELGFIRTGAESSLKNFPNYPVETYQLSYITLPILCNYRLTNKLSLGVGLSGSSLFDGVKKSDTKEFNIYDQLEPSDVAALVGIDYAVIKFLDVSLKFSYGLLPVFSYELIDNTGNSFGEVKTYNQHIQMSLRYNFFRR